MNGAKKFHRGAAGCGPTPSAPSGRLPLGKGEKVVPGNAGESPASTRERRRVAGYYLEQLLEALRLREKERSALFRDEQLVFEPDAELSGDVNARFIAEHVAGADGAFVAGDEIVPFV